MHLQNRPAPGNIRSVEDHLPVESSRPQECGIEHIRAIGGGNHDDVGTAVEAVHLHQDLIQRLLALVVTSAQSGATLATDGIDLIDEHDTGRAFLCLFEEIAHPAGADADEHFHEFGTGNAEERDPRFAGHRTREQSFAGTRWANQQHTPRDSGAERLELIWIFEKFDDLDKLFFCLVDTRDIGKVTVGLCW